MTLVQSGARPASINDDIKHGKTCHHWATPGRTCIRGSSCKFVHAWVNPKKNGVCRNHCLGKCFYTDTSCYFQHLPIPIQEYEELAEGTKNYHELSLRVDFRARQRSTERKNWARQKTRGSHSVDFGRRPFFCGPLRSPSKRSPTAMTLSLSNFSRAIGSERKRVSTIITGKSTMSHDSLPSQQQQQPQQQQHQTQTPFSFMEGNFNSRLAQWQRQNLMAPLQLANKVEKHNQGHLKPTTEESIVSRNLELLSLAESTSDSEESTGSSDASTSSAKHGSSVFKMDDEMKAKPAKDWNPDQVSKFILSLGESSWWKSYADQMKEEDVDGATLMEYVNPQALIEDFRGMKKGHARVISNAVKTNFGKE